jgi:hypothetical protein
LKKSKSSSIKKEEEKSLSAMENLDDFEDFEPPQIAIKPAAKSLDIKRTERSDKKDGISAGIPVHVKPANPESIPQPVVDRRKSIEKQKSKKNNQEIDDVEKDDRKNLIEISKRGPEIDEKTDRTSIEKSKKNPDEIDEKDDRKSIETSKKNPKIDEKYDDRKSVPVSSRKSIPVARRKSIPVDRRKSMEKSKTKSNVELITSKKVSDNENNSDSSDGIEVIYEGASKSS